MQEMSLKEIEQLLEESLIGRLSMADRDGRPYTVPLPFCWHDASLYLRLPLSGRKGTILEQNNRVCFEVDRYTQTLDDYASVLIEGTLVAVFDLDEKARVKQSNDAKYNRLRRGHRPGHGRGANLAELPLRRIVVERLSGRKKETPRIFQHVNAAGGL